MFVLFPATFSQFLSNYFFDPPPEWKDKSGRGNRAANCLLGRGSQDSLIDPP